MGKDQLIKVTGKEYNTVPDAVMAKLQAVEQGELEERVFDKGDIAETICDRIASGKYGEEELGEETRDTFHALIEKLSDGLEE